MTPEGIAIQCIQESRVRVADATGMAARNVEVSFGEVDGKSMWTIAVYIGWIPSQVSRKRHQVTVNGTGDTLAEAESDVIGEAKRRRTSAGKS